MKSEICLLLQHKRRQRVETFLTCNTAQIRNFEPNRFIIFVFSIMLRAKTFFYPDDVTSISQ